MESCLTPSLTIWLGIAIAKDIKKLNAVVRNAPYSIGFELESLESMYTKRVLKRARTIKEDTYHQHIIFVMPLPSGRSLKSNTDNTERFVGSFYPKAVQYVNENFR